MNGYAEPAGDIFVMIDGNIVRIGGSNNDLPGVTIDNSVSELDFYNNLQRVDRTISNAEGRGGSGKIPDRVKKFLEMLSETSPE